VGTTYQGQLPVAMYGYDRSYTIWKWIPGADKMKLVSQEVPLWAYADIMAEESALQALELGVAQAGGNSNDAFTQDTEALLACIHMHMYTEGRGRYYNGSDLERKFITKLLGEHGIVPNFEGLGLGSLGGTRILNLALERSLADGYAAVSVALCDAIAKQNDSGAVGAGSALVRATGDPDRSVQYAAARALVRLGSTKSYGTRTEVETLAARNLQEQQARSVLVIIEDQDLRKKYLTALAGDEGLGLSATGARTLEEGADLAMQGPPWDAIIIEGSLAVAPVFVFELPALEGANSTRERSEPIFHLLHKDVRTANIPVLIATKASEMASRKSDLEGLGVEDSRFISYTGESGVDKESLGETLRNIWEDNVEGPKNKTNQMVVDMADAIESLDPSTTKYSVEKMLKALSGGLRLPGRSSPAREKICKAISKLVSGKKVSGSWLHKEIVPNLLDTLNSESAVDRPSVKGAAAEALGNCYQYSKGAWDEDGRKALTKLLRLRYDLNNIPIDDDDPKVAEKKALRAKMILEVAAARNAAGEALGKAPTTPQQRLEIAKIQAVNPHTPHPDKRTAGD
jgi:HEAT repeat protein